MYIHAPLYVCVCVSIYISMYIGMYCYVYWYAYQYVYLYYSLYISLYYSGGDTYGGTMQAWGCNRYSFSADPVLCLRTQGLADQSYLGDIERQ